MTRVDLYTAVHKGVRTILTDSARLVSRTDFAAPESARVAAESVRRMLGVLHDHAEHEERFILPELAKIDGQLAAELEADHARVGQIENEIARLIERIESASRPERLAIGERLHERAWRLVAEHLMHMGREEGAANRVFWIKCTDDELREIEGRVVGSIPPDRMAEYLAFMLPAMNPAERGELLLGLHGAMPGEAFRALLAPTQAALGFETWAAIAAPAGLPIESSFSTQPLCSTGEAR
jgi:hemerythrin superfamily protein